MKNLEIERLRAIAVLLVVCHHYPVKLPFIQQGWAGVTLFFVISGYVITLSLQRMLATIEIPSNAQEQGTLARLASRFGAARSALAAFFVKRAYRILPLAIVWALVPLAFAAWFNQSGRMGPVDGMIKEVISIFTLQYNYAAMHGITLQLGHYWSLVVEEHFYLMLPLLMVALPTRHGRLAGVLAGIALVALVLRPFLQFDGPQSHLWAYRHWATHRNLDALLAGSAIALIRSAGWGEAFKRLPRWMGWGVIALCLAQIAVFPGIMPKEYMDGYGAVPLWGAAAVLVFLASLEQERILPGRVFGFPVIGRLLEYIGARSYGIYLINSFAIALMAEIRLRLEQSGATGWLAALYSGTGNVLFFGCLVWFLTVASYELIERPCIRRGRRVADGICPETGNAPSQASLDRTLSFAANKTTKAA